MAQREIKQGKEVGGVEWNIVSNSGQGRVTEKVRFDQRPEGVRGSHVSTWGQSPRPREEPEKTEEGNQTDLKQSGQGQLAGGKGREVLGAAHVAWSTGRTLAFAPSATEPQEGSGKEETWSDAESPGPLLGVRNRRWWQEPEQQDQAGGER